MRKKSSPHKIVVLLLAVSLVVLGFSGCSYSGEQTPQVTVVPPSLAPVPPSNAVTSPVPVPKTPVSPGILPPARTTPVTFPPGIDLEFETIGISAVGEDEYLQYQGREPRIQAITYPSSPPESINWIRTDHKAQVLNVDYSRYFVILTFHGFRNYGASIGVKRIWQNENVVYVMASFNDPGSQPGATASAATSSAYDIVKVRKERMPEFGALTFRMLDQNGKELAMTTATVTK